MIKIKELVPEVDDLLSLEPEEIGGIIFQILTSLKDDERSYLHKGNFVLTDNIKDYPSNKWNEIKKALIEGWTWLESEGLIAQDPEQSVGWVFITRRGRKLEKVEDFKAYRNTGVLKKEILHPILVEKVWSAYLRGEYDIAILIAFKEVEIMVRKLSGLNNDLYGVELMKRAFNVGCPLAQPNLPAGEQVALMNLFVGAIGWFKNPQSHRNVKVESLSHAVRVLMFASHLLSLAESSYFEAQLV